MKLTQLGASAPTSGSKDHEANGHSSQPQPRESEPCSNEATVIGKPVRERDREHLMFVAAHACLDCGRKPSDPRHLKFAEQRPMGRKVSDRFTVPICRLHHRELHRRGNEHAWWQRQPPQRPAQYPTVTEEGKRTPRQNAVRHGLTAETVIDALEDAEDSLHGLRSRRLFGTCCR
jgi:hypothetical protein